MKSPTNDTDQNLTTAEPTTCETASAAAPPHFHPQNPTDNPGECESAIHPVPAIPTGSQSTIPSKLTPEELAAVHEALADPDRAPYGVIFDKLALREKGIGFTAFYNYARPIRLHEACLNQAGLSRTLAPHAHKLMPDLIAARLLAALVDETSPRVRFNFSSMPTAWPATSTSPTAASEHRSKT
ncbi:MAG: hypothetical protein IPK83_15690 [Planctomycetes bacterium]|nr:hypothetical protein [Planctomycetota bacterium]